MSSGSVVYLEVPYAKRTEAKLCGCRWSQEEKKWWVDKDTNPQYQTIINKWKPTVLPFSGTNIAPTHLHDLFKVSDRIRKYSTLYAPRQDKDDKQQKKTGYERNKTTTKECKPSIQRRIPRVSEQKGCLQQQQKKPMSMSCIKSEQVSLQPHLQTHTTPTIR